VKEMNEEKIRKKNKERQLLSEVVPLEKPYAVNFNISNACNFKCFYCFHSQKGKKEYQEGKMDYSIFQTCIDQIKRSGIHLKNINLCGYGEPVLHQDFCRMVKYAKMQKVTDCVETITNASVLTPEYCDRILDSGLDKMRISLQGLTEEDYRDVAQVEFCFDRLYRAIQYLYRHKKQLFLYVKIMDVMVKTEERKKKFFDLFEKCADEVYIENLMPLSQLDYSKANSDFSKTLYGEELKKTQICSQPFYSCTVDIDGTVFPCCMLPVPERFDNLTLESLNEIWNGEKYLSFLTSFLGSLEKWREECKRCRRYQYMALEKDSLDGKEEELLKKFQIKLEKIRSSKS